MKSSSCTRDIARLVEHIYDESKSELVRRIETPLGSLSKSQIERGADALRALRFAIARDHQDKIVPLTSQYYTLSRIAWDAGPTSTMSPSTPSRRPTAKKNCSS